MGTLPLSIRPFRRSRNAVVNIWIRAFDKGLRIQGEKQQQQHKSEMGKRREVTESPVALALSNAPMQPMQIPVGSCSFSLVRPLPA